MHFSILFAAAGLSQLRHKEARGRAMWAEREILARKQRGLAPYRNTGNRLRLRHHFLESVLVRVPRRARESSKDH